MTFLGLPKNIPIGKNHIARTFGCIMSESDIAADTAESLGLNEITVLAIIGIIVAGIITRFLTMLAAPKVLNRIIRSENIKRKTVKDSDKALGSAAGAAVAYFLTLQLIDSIQSLSLIHI